MKPEFESWANALIVISNRNFLDKNDRQQLKAIAEKLKEFKAVVEVTRK